MSIAVPYIAKTKPWLHQEEAIHFATARASALIAAAMGTGKTLITITILQTRGHRRTLITCPLSVVASWGREFDKHAALPFVVCLLDRGSVKEKLAAAQAALARAEETGLPLVVVVNHESLWREPFASWSLRAGFECLVVDECHRAKAPGGKLSRFLHRLAQRIPYRLGLTGTPMPHGLEDVYAQFRFLDEGVFGTSFTRFRALFCRMGGFEGRQIIGYQNEGLFHQKFMSRAFQVDASVLDLPEAVDVRREFTLSGEAARIYRELQNEFYSEVENGQVTAANALTRLLRLQQVTSGHIKNDEGETRELHAGKAALFADLLEDADEPLVVFARFRHDLKQIERVAKAAGRSYAELSGSRRELEKWQRGEADILGTQIQSGGVGIDLTRSRIAVYWSVPFDLGQYLQSRARIHRPGQERSCLYVHLLASATVDAQVYRALERRQNVVEAILKGQFA
jgi:SNF2 family DNA or RNA helicase